jgi:hypothetical protein
VDLLLRQQLTSFSFCPRYAQTDIFTPLYQAVVKNISVTTDRTFRHNQAGNVFEFHGKPPLEELYQINYEPIKNK